MGENMGQLFDSILAREARRCPQAPCRHTTSTRAELRTGDGILIEPSDTPNHRTPSAPVVGGR